MAAAAEEIERAAVVPSATAAVVMRRRAPRDERGVMLDGMCGVSFGLGSLYAVGSEGRDGDEDQSWLPVAGSSSARGRLFALVLT
jgi:hypothetical protein